MLRRVVCHQRRCYALRARLSASASSTTTTPTSAHAHVHAPPVVVSATPSGQPQDSITLPQVRWFSAPPIKKQPIVLREEDLEESFVKGSGKGGQKINKVRNCVLLKHTPTGLLVRCQKTRSLDDNRRVARKLLVQKLDDQLNGELSARNVKFNKLRKRKANKKAKTNKKYSADKAAAEDEGEESGGDDEDEEDSDDDYEDDEDDDDGLDVDVEKHKFKSKKKLE